MRRGTMECRVLPLSAALLLLASAAPAGLQGYRPIPDCYYPKDTPVAIEWKEDWDATYQANLQRWQKEIDAQETDNGRRAARLSFRAIQLLEALSARYVDLAENRIRAGREIVARLDLMGRTGQANYMRKRIIDEFPGRLSLAIEQLQGILEKTNPTAVDEGYEWLEYAAQRVLALGEAGYVSPTHPAIGLALQAQLAGRRARHDLLEAADVLARIRQRRGGDYFTESSEAHLLVQAGLGGEAMARWQALWAQTNSPESLQMVNALGRMPYLPPPTFTRPMNLEMRWEGLRSGPAGVQADAVVRMIKEAAGSTGLTSWTASKQVSIWTAMDQFLLSQPASELAEIRRLNQADAPDLPGDVSGESDYLQVLGAFRRCPWAPQVHKALVQVGQQAVRRGPVGWAAPAFRDALTHSEDQQVRAAAQAGLWLAMAQEPTSRRLLQQQLGDAPKDATYPWVGGRKTAAAIAEDLLCPPAPLSPAPLDLARAPQVVLQVPVCPWPKEALQAVPADNLPSFHYTGQVQMLADGGVLLSGPNLLACYDKGSPRPRWRRTLPLACAVHTYNPEEGPLAGHFQPAVGDGRVFTRWGLDWSRTLPVTVAAMNLRDGAMLWSSADDPAWAGVLPISDPTLADGRVYVLAAPPGGFVTTSLFCMDERTGAVLWKRPLATQTTALIPADMYSRGVEVLHYGSAVAVSEGQAYCLTNQGCLVKVDARDGLIQWARTYDRAAVGSDNRSYLLRRLGSRPILAGGKLLVLPRDRHGVFALDQATGELLWDDYLLGSDDAVGLLAESLLVKDLTHVTAIEVDSGAVRWRVEFPEGIIGTPKLAGASVYVVTGRRLCRIDASTGRLAEGVPWGQAGCLREIGACGDVLAGVTEQSAEDAPSDPAEPVEPSAPEGSGKTFALPVQCIWRLRRRDPRLLTPPPEAKQPPGSGYLLSEGVLERVEINAGGRIAWRQMLPPGWQGVEWIDGGLLLEYPTRAVLLDAATGKPRWETQLPFHARNWRVLPRHIVAGRFHADRYIGVLNRADGKLLWHSRLNDVFDPYMNMFWFSDVAWDGQNLHLLWPFLRAGPEGMYDTTLRPADGGVLAVRQIGERGSYIAAGDNCCYFVAKDSRLRKLSLEPAAKPVEYAAVFKDEKLGELQPIRAHLGKWLQVQFIYTWRDYRNNNWILSQSDAAYELRLDRDFMLQGDRAFLQQTDAIAPNNLQRDANKLVTIDLPTKVRSEFLLGDAGMHAATHYSLFGWQEGNRVFAVSGARVGWPQKARHLQLDMFDSQTGKRLASQELSEAYYWTGPGWPAWTEFNQFRYSDGVLVVTDGDGLHAFAASPPAVVRQATVAYRAPRPVQPDGLLSEWDPVPTVEMKGAGGQEARLLVSHDDANLYLAVRYRADAAHPRCGPAAAPGGDRLEVGVGESLRWSMGLDARGEFVCEPFAGGRAPAGVVGAVGIDAAAGQITYEVAIPKRSLGIHGSVPMSVALWSDQAGAGRCRLLEWGRALGGEEMAEYCHELVRLSPMTRAREAPALAFADRTIDLNCSFELIQQNIALHAGSPQALVAPCAQFMKTHPQSWRCLKIMEQLDGVLRSDASDPSRQVLELAQQAGVAELIRATYARQAAGYLSQWIYIEDPPEWIGLQLSQGPGDQDRTWEHRAFWGQMRVWGQRGPYPSSLRYAGDMPPKGTWVELRVPLIWIDLHDKPVCGYHTCQHGGKVYFGRASLVADGREHLVFDGSVGDGKGEGNVQWVDKPVRSGGRSLLIVPVPVINNPPYWRFTFVPKAPIAGHVIQPPPAPKPDPKQSADVLAELPRLGPAPIAFGYLQQLLAGEEVPARKADLCLAFVRAIPDHPQAFAVLDQAWTLQVGGAGAAAESMEALFREAPLPPQVVYRFRRGRLHTERNYIRQWQALAPLPADAKGPTPETDGVVLDRAYAGAKTRVRWERFDASPDGANRLMDTYAPKVNVSAFAACWVYTAAARSAVLEISFGDSGKAWLNGKQVYAGRTPGGVFDPAKGASVPLSLPAGWSTLLVRCDGGANGDWFFRAEIVDASGKGLGGMKLSPTPPEAASQSTSAATTRPAPTPAR